MFYRSGWLRCDVFICVVVVCRFELVLTCGVYCYYTIILYLLSFLSYSLLLPNIPLFLSSSNLLLSSHLFFYSFPSSSNQYLSVLTYTYLYSSSNLFFIPFSSPLSSSPIPTFILYLSVLPYGYLCSLIFQTILTPHVLSEWMVEVCRFY